MSSTHRASLPTRGRSAGSQVRFQGLRAVRVAGLAAVVAGASLLGALLVPGEAPAREGPRAKILLLELPPEGVKTYRAIHSGGPFPHEKDGSVFGNREGLLPDRRRGFYREYTVPTPGASDRGARRIVCGGERPKSPEACYYTADHYSSFRLIVD